MRFAHILNRVTGTPWLITEDALHNITQLLEARIRGDSVAAELVGGDGGKVAPGLPGARPGDAIIPIHGVIGKRLSPLEMMCGGTDVDALALAYDTANADPAISRIILDVDSPGGTVTGVPELAEHILATKSKEVLAVSDTLIGSAAYYLAAAADRILATPTARIGSIGTVLSVRERAENKPDEDGMRLRVFRSGQHKMMGLDGPLTDEQAAHLQGEVDTLGDDFRDFVTRTRRAPAGALQGFTYSGPAAVRARLVDAIVPNLAASLA